MLACLRSCQMEHVLPTSHREQFFHTQSKTKRSHERFHHIAITHSLALKNIPFEAILSAMHVGRNNRNNTVT